MSGAPLRTHLRAPVAWSPVGSDLVRNRSLRAHLVGYGCDLSLGRHQPMRAPVQLDGGGGWKPPRTSARSSANWMVVWSLRWSLMIWMFTGKPSGVIPMGALVAGRTEGTPGLAKCAPGCEHGQAILRTSRRAGLDAPRDTGRGLLIHRDRTHAYGVEQDSVRRQLAERARPGLPTRVRFRPGPHSLDESTVHLRRPPPAVADLLGRAAATFYDRRSCKGQRSGSTPGRVDRPGLRAARSIGVALAPETITAAIWKGRRSPDELPRDDRDATPTSARSPNLPANSGDSSESEVQAERTGAE